MIISSRQPRLALSLQDRRNTNKLPPAFNETNHARKHGRCHGVVALLDKSRKETREVSRSGRFISLCLYYCWTSLCWYDIQRDHAKYISNYTATAEKIPWRFSSTNCKTLSSANNTPLPSRVYWWSNCLLRSKVNKNIDHKQGLRQDSVPLTAFGFYCWWLAWWVDSKPRLLNQEFHGTSTNEPHE